MLVFSSVHGRCVAALVVVDLTDVIDGTLALLFVLFAVVVLPLPLPLPLLLLVLIS